MFCSFTGNWLNPVRCLLVRFPGDFSPFKRPSGAFFSLRCLIYKVHAVPVGTLLLYSTSFRLSSTFFKSFWRPIRFRISSNFLSLPHSWSFVKNFFQKFLTFRFRVRRGNFFMLPHLVVTVKYFFHFLSAAVLTAATAWLEYHALPLLSTPFFLFFRFFLLFSSALHFSRSICYDKSDC